MARGLPSGADRLPPSVQLADEHWTWLTEGEPNPYKTPQSGGSSPTSIANEELSFSLKVLRKLQSWPESPSAALMTPSATPPSSPTSRSSSPRCSSSSLELDPPLPTVRCTLRASQLLLSFPLSLYLKTTVCTCREADVRCSSGSRRTAGHRGYPWLCSVRRSFRCGQHLRRPRQPCRHLRTGCRRANHDHHRNFLLDRSARRFHRCVLPLETGDWRPGKKDRIIPSW